MSRGLSRPSTIVTNLKFFLILPLFADDIKLYSCVETDGTSGDLDASLNNLILWANRWQLKVNLSKCNVMRIGRNSSLGVYDYNSDVIPRVNSVTDL